MVEWVESEAESERVYGPQHVNQLSTKIMRLSPPAVSKLPRPTVRTRPPGGVGKKNFLRAGVQLRAGVSLCASVGHVLESEKGHCIFEACDDQGTIRDASMFEMMSYHYRMIFSRVDKDFSGF